MRILSKFALAILAGTALAAAASPAFAGDELTITSWGGAYQESQRKAYFEPFIKDGNKVTEEEYNGEIAKLRAMVESKAVTWDVVDVDTQTALAACAEGVLETIDWGKLGLDRTKFVGGDLQDCAVPTIVYATVIAYCRCIRSAKVSG
jgi:putative spermidine/putrescine transport system substrate-binding protein